MSLRILIPVLRRVDQLLRHCKDDKTAPDIHHFQRIPLETEIHYLHSVGNYQKSIRVSKTGSAALERYITERFAYHLDTLASGNELYFHG